MSSMSSTSTDVVSSIDIWTIQLGQWRLAKEKDIFLLDTTAKSGVKAFAPDFDKVMAYKAGKLSEEEYTKFYLAKMELSKQRYPNGWDSLTKRPRIALACYCRAKVFCHRHLFAQLAKDYLESRNIEVVLRGELLKT